MKIKVISPSAVRAQQVARIVQGSSPGLDVVTAVSGLGQLTEAVNGSRPALLVLDGVDVPGLEGLGALAQSQPEVESIVLSAEQSADFLRRAMQLGVREVLPTALDEDALREAVRRAARKRAPAAPQRTPAQVLAVMGCKGGSGTTFVAANLAHTLSERGRKVGLLDFDLQFGDALLMLSDAPPRSHVGELAGQIARLDAELLTGAMTKVGDALHVLAAPPELSQALEVQPEHADAIVRQARQGFDDLVVDLGRTVTGVTLRVLDQASQVFPVLQLTVPGLRDARRLQQLFRSLDVPSSQVTWVVNRFQKNGEIPLDMLKQALGTDRVCTVPNHFGVVSAAVNQGRPLSAMNRHHPVQRALSDLADAVVPADRPRRDGWLSTLFGH